MRTVDRTRVRAPVERVFQAAAEVERWPELLLVQVLHKYQVQSGLTTRTRMAKADEPAVIDAAAIRAKNKKELWCTLE